MIYYGKINFYNNLFELHPLLYISFTITNVIST
jgi:hypothetical protein